MQRVRPPLHRDAVVHAVDRVVRRGLERRQEVLPARDQVDVDRLDVVRVDQAQARVARGRDEVVLAASSAAVRVHEREHLLRGAGVLAVDDAARLLLERLARSSGRCSAGHSITLSGPSPLPIFVGGPLPGSLTVAAGTANAAAIAATTTDGTKTCSSCESSSRALLLDLIRVLRPPREADPLALAPRAPPARTSRGSAGRRRARRRRRGRRRSA